MYAIGLMSGTSLDGIDVAYCKIEGFGYNSKIELLDFITYPIADSIKEKIKRACLSKDFSVRELCSLNFEFGKELSKAVAYIKIKNNLKDEDIDFVASHGQTIYHLPNPEKDEVKSTLQIGEPSVIAYDHKVKVISNFRVMDMAASGEGAPLVPYSEKILYAKKDKVVALHNIGGISNLTYIDNDKVVAFDSGVGNMMIDEAMRRFYGKEYDYQGEIAASGKLSKTLFEELKKHPFLAKKPPKSTGREEFGSQYVSYLLDKYQDVKPEDIIHTFTYFTAYCIYQGYYDFFEKIPDEIIIAGGGAYNLTLLKMIKTLLKDSVIKTQEDIGYSSEAKEAIAFVVLGNETLNLSPSNVKSVTGARDEVILGNITENPFRRNYEMGK